MLHAFCSPTFKQLKGTRMLNFSLWEHLLVSLNSIVLISKKRNSHLSHRITQAVKLDNKAMSMGPWPVIGAGHRQCGLGTTGGPGWLMQPPQSLSFCSTQRGTRKLFIQLLVCSACVAWDLLEQDRHPACLWRRECRENQTCPCSNRWVELDILSTKKSLFQSEFPHLRTAALNFYN